jgi:hypothetical protein
MSVRERARLGAIALGLGGAALALIQILENTLSTFSPRPVVSALLTVTVAMAGVSLGRARSVATRQQFLTSALWRWPLPTAAEADPLTLGIFPPRFADGSKLGPYVPRSIDSALDEALAQRALVLVIGPARAGKSRSAYEAVLRSMPDRLLLNPIDGDALRSISGDPGLASHDAVWWLDDLDHHLSSLDGRALNEVLTGGHVVVASIRDDAWQTLLSADGTTGAQGRRLLGAAHTIHLPAVPDADELAAAAKLYPDVDVAAGIGAALSADGSSSRASMRSPTPEAPPRRRPDLALALALATTLALGAICALATTTGGFSVPPPPPPIAVQLAKIDQQNSAAGLTLAYHTQADLRGPGNASWIYVWKYPLNNGAPTNSDRLEIYDDVGGRLKLDLDFTPTAGGKNIPGLPLEIDRKTISVVDLDGTGQQREFIAGYVPNGGGIGGLPTGVDLPVMAAWDGSRYVLSPLLPIDLPYTETHPLNSFLVGYYPLADAKTHLELKANAVSSFAVVPRHRSPALLAVLGQTASDSTTAVFLYEFYDRLASSHYASSPTIMCDPNQDAGSEFVRFQPFKSNAVGPGGTSLYEYTKQLTALAPALAHAFTFNSTAPNSEYGHDTPSCQ